MWPWGHAAVGYLCYRLLLARTGRRPDGLAVVLLGVGTQLPDLIDKPLGWYTTVLPAGRSLGHSVVFALCLTVVAWRIARRDDRVGLATALGVGYWSHLLADAYQPALTGEFGSVAFLAYPFVALPPEPPGIGLRFLLRSLTLGPFLVAELLVTAGALALWLRDGVPGLATLGALVRPGGP